MSDTPLRSSAPATPCCEADCCGGEKQERRADEVIAVVREQYGRSAKSRLSSNDSGVRAIAEAFGYSADEFTFPPEASSETIFHDRQAHHRTCPCQRTSTTAIGEKCGDEHDGP